MNEINVPRPNNLDAFWMPYTDNKYYKGTPRMLARAEGMSYFTPEGKEILDGTAGLFDAAAVLAARRGRETYAPRPSLLVVENTHNRGGGSVWSLAAFREVAHTARSMELRVHVDGARLWNASIAAGL